MGTDVNEKKANAIVGFAILLSLFGNFSGLLFSLSDELFFSVRFLVSMVAVSILLYAILLVSKNMVIVFLVSMAVCGWLIFLLINILYPVFNCDMCEGVRMTDLVVYCIFYYFLIFAEKMLITKYKKANSFK